MKYTTPTRHSVNGWDKHHDDGGLDDESNMDPPREPSLDDAKVTLFSKPEPISTKPEDGERSSDEEEDPLFMAYSPLVCMYNVNLSEDDALEFLDLPHKRCFTRSSQDGFRYDSWLNTTNSEGEPRTSVPVLIANTRSKLRLRRHVCPQYDICVILDRGIRILAVIERQRSLRDRTCHRYYISYGLDSFLVQLWARVMVAPTRVGVVLVVGVGRMTHLDRTKNAEVFASLDEGV
ncbi:hypothetical protein PVK06_028372 [Gossypium arboreum]|uniref:Uncharacterized protein n=1 Tax=Gossypium arboreum TaxID=29729 RepID=A0ABR0P325_GOSAR|nr:hypothetical protein PVK06_028372 [Gossypium arboreum]